MVPEYLLRKIDAAIDFGGIYDFVKIFTVKIMADQALILLSF